MRPNQLNDYALLLIPARGCSDAGDENRFMQFNALRCLLRHLGIKGCLKFNQAPIGLAVER